MALKFHLLRPDDLLDLQVEAINLKIVTQRKTRQQVLSPAEAEKPAYLVITFPPQTIHEQAVFESSPNNPPPPPTGQDDPYSDSPVQPPPPPSPPNAPPGLPLPAKARLGRPSRLVFRLPKEEGFQIPLTTAGLLDWSQLSLVVSPLAALPPEPTPAQRQSAPAIKEPKELETAIELPYKLIISPNTQVGWQHALLPKTHAGRTELWHTRLAHKNPKGVLSEISRLNPAPLRAIWSAHYNPNKFKATDPPLFGKNDPDMKVLTAMWPSDRHELVVLTSAFKGYIKDHQDYSTYEPRPFFAEQLILTSLGGWLKSRGNWDPPVPYHIRLPVVVKPQKYFPKFIKDFSDLLAKPLDFPFYAPNLDFAAFLEGGATPDQAAMPDGELEAAQTAFSPADDLEFAAFSAAMEAEGLDLPGSRLSLGEAAINPGLAGMLANPAYWIRHLGEKGDSLSLSEWVHNATLGRDHYVRIVYEGHLWPFGHRAALIKVTERKIRDVPVSKYISHPVAYLIQRMFIVVRQPVKDYTSDKVAPYRINGGRALPFTNIRLTTLVTPDIANPEGPARIRKDGDETIYSFWVRLGAGANSSDDFKFHAIASDIAGNKIDFTASLIFVPFSESKRAMVKAVYDASGEERRCQVPAQKMTFAPKKNGATADNTTLDTSALYFSTHTAPAGKEMGEFLPYLLKAGVNLPAVEALLGRPAETTIGFHKPYLSQGLVNPAGVFAEIVKEKLDEPTKLLLDEIKSEFAASQAGGIATPSQAIKSLAREYGPLAGDPLQAASDAFDPNDYFQGFDDLAKIFGSFSLMDLLPSGTMGANAPKMQVLQEPVQGKPTARKLIATLDWVPKIHSIKTGIINLNIKDTSKLEIKGHIEKIVELPPPPQPDPGYALFQGELTDFTIDLIGIIEVLFVSFSFKSESGKKPDVNVQLASPDPVRFQEDLQFVEELRKQIPPGLFGDGPSLDISPSGVKAGFSIGLPPVAVGVFALKDVTLATFLELPFQDGRPTIDFAVSSREHPFNLTVAFLGGGGFFHIQLDTLGIKMLEMALEFGAQASINLGVASGGVYIMAGIYFAIERREIGGKQVDAASLSGYLRMGGELSVLGLISVSLEFNLSFTYEFQKNAASGRATLTVKVEVLFFSTSVELTVEKRFGGSSGDPKFGEVFETPQIWNTYATAFA